MEKPQIVMAADHGGFKMKEHIRTWLQKAGYEVDDQGCYSAESTDYPDHISKAAEKVSSGSAARAIIMCGSGNGAAIRS